MESLLPSLGLGVPATGADHIVPIAMGGRQDPRQPSRNLFGLPSPRYVSYPSAMEHPVMPNPQWRRRAGAHTLRCCSNERCKTVATTRRASSEIGRSVVSDSAGRSRCLTSSFLTVSFVFTADLLWHCFLGVRLPVGVECVDELLTKSGDTDTRATTIPCPVL
jgi:hypothetical protein